MHAANKTLFPKQFVLVATVSEVFLKDLFSEFEDIDNSHLQMH